jgi:hypothetical protein
MTTSKIPEIFHIKPNIKMALYSWFALKKKTVFFYSSRLIFSIYTVKEKK